MGSRKDAFDRKLNLKFFLSVPSVLSVVKTNITVRLLLPARHRC
jgi:hypothetical protein